MQDAPPSRPVSGCLELSTSLPLSPQQMLIHSATIPVLCSLASFSFFSLRLFFPPACPIPSACACICDGVCVCLSCGGFVP